MLQPFSFLLLIFVLVKYIFAGETVFFWGGGGIGCYIDTAQLGSSDRGPNQSRSGAI